MLTFFYLKKNIGMRNFGLKNRVCLDSHIEDRLNIDFQKLPKTISTGSGLPQFAS